MKIKPIINICFECLTYVQCQFSIMETIISSSFNNRLASHISTMTIFFKLNIDHIDLSIDKWNEGIIGGKYKIRVPGSLKSKKKIFKNFYNSLSLIHDVPNPLNSKKNRLICAKIFKNGGIQVTGCQTEDDSKRMIYDIISSILEPLKLVESENAIGIKSHTINMINIVCNMKHHNIIPLECSFDLYKLNAILENEYKIVSNYDRDKYCGLNVKIPLEEKGRKATILCFTSGMFIITGVKSNDDIRAVKHKFIKVLEDKLGDYYL